MFLSHKSPTIPSFIFQFNVLNSEYSLLLHKTKNMEENSETQSSQPFPMSTKLPHFSTMLVGYSFRISLLIFTQITDTYSYFLHHLIFYFYFLQKRQYTLQCSTFVLNSRDLFIWSVSCGWAIFNLSNKSFYLFLIVGNYLKKNENCNDWSCIYSSSCNQ